MTALLIVGAVALVLVLAWALTEATVWWQARNDAEDAGYAGLRTPGMGVLTETPIYDQLAAETAADAARDLDVEWRLETGGRGQ